MTFYKAFDENLCCRNLQYRIGETTSVEGDIKMCKNGIHCCEEALDCLQYYKRDNSRFCEVVPSGEMITKGDKTVCRSITVIREIVGEDLSSLLSGLQKWWYENGQLWCEHVYKDGKLDGPYKGWYENGQLWYDHVYKDGKLDGPCKEWYANGQIQNEQTYKDGRLDDQHKKWYPNGQLREECTYKDGKLEGPYKDWYANGQLLCECTYKDGQRVNFG